MSIKNHSKLDQEKMVQIMKEMYIKGQSQKVSARELVEEVSGKLQIHVAK